MALDICARTDWYVKFLLLSNLLISFPGDMQLTKAEIAQTQIIVTTPEKWDVVTRKPTGEGEIASVCNISCIERNLLMI